jgi:hypothetical protein
MPPTRPKFTPQVSDIDLRTRSFVVKCISVPASSMLRTPRPPMLRTQRDIEEERANFTMEQLSKVAWVGLPVKLFHLPRAEDVMSGKTADVHVGFVRSSMLDPHTGLQFEIEIPPETGASPRSDQQRAITKRAIEGILSNTLCDVSLSHVYETVGMNGAGGMRLGINKRPIEVSIAVSDTAVREGSYILSGGFELPSGQRPKQLAPEKRTMRTDYAVDASLAAQLANERGNKNSTIYTQGTVACSHGHRRTRTMAAEAIDYKALYEEQVKHNEQMQAEKEQLQAEKEAKLDAAANSALARYASTRADLTTPLANVFAADTAKSVTDALEKGEAALKDMLDMVEPGTDYKTRVVENLAKVVTSFDTGIVACARMHAVEMGHKDRKIQELESLLGAKGKSDLLQAATRATQPPASASAAHATKHATVTPPASAPVDNRARLGAAGTVARTTGVKRDASSMQQPVHPPTSSIQQVFQERFLKDDVAPKVNGDLPPWEQHQVQFKLVDAPQ